VRHVDFGLPQNGKPLKNRATGFARPLSDPRRLPRPLDQRLGFPSIRPSAVGWCPRLIRCYLPYRRLLKTATDEERRNYLGRLIVEEQQNQKDAGDSEYQY
jgi:hypothetical protein